MLKRIGKIVNFYGIKGEIKVVNISSDPQKRYIPNYTVIINDRTFTIESVRLSKNNIYIIKLQGIDSANDAVELKDLDIFMDVEVAEGEMFFDDILGFEIFDSNHVLIGVVDDIKEIQGRIYLIIGEKMIPFIKNVFIDILDKDSKSIHLTSYGDTVL